jgi:hemoglobin-like flavoprotein
LNRGEVLQPSITPDLNLSAEQRLLILDSIDSLRECAEPFALLFYGRLFELDPSARRLFHIDLAVQGRKLMEMLSSVAESLNDFGPMRSRLAELGRKHASYGVRSEQYETLVKAMMWSLSQALSPNLLSFAAP